ncbi:MULTISPECIES: glycosyltransferase family 2 protein [Bacteria]|uniref:glycosyltransferase family 2 protein n=1 Tax=Bacteria TaxID=2 RepID=UPI003F359831
MEPLVSIITPSYNSKDFIGETIESVLNQTYKNWELLIIDDCSTDDSSEVIKKYTQNDSRIKYLKNKKNSGPATSRNVGIEKAEGKYIAFLDSDDFWDKEKLKYQIEFMEKNNLLITHTDYFFTDSIGKIVKKVITSEEIDYKRLLKGNQFKTMCMIMRSDLVKKNRMPIIKHEDYAFFLDLLKEAPKSLKVSKSLAMCRLRERSVSSNKLKSAVWTWKIYKNYEKLGFIKSFYYFCNYIYNSILKYK